MAMVLPAGGSGFGSGSAPLGVAHGDGPSCWCFSVRVGGSPTWRRAWRWSFLLACRFSVHRLVVYDRSQADMPGGAKCLKCRLEPDLIMGVTGPRYGWEASGNVRRHAASTGERALDRGRVDSVTIRGNVLTLRYHAHTRC